MMRYFLKTSDPVLVQSYRQLTVIESARWKYVKQIALSWGFDEVGMTGFSRHVAFFKVAAEDDRHNRVGPSIEGFRPCRKNPTSYHNDERYFRYYFHGRNKLATQLQKQLDEGMPPAPKELSGNQFRYTVDSAFCIRQGLPNEHFAGNKILYSMVYLLRGDILLMSLPVTDEKVVIPKGCEELTERAWGAEIDKHNAAVGGAKD